MMNQKRERLKLAEERVDAKQQKRLNHWQHIIFKPSWQAGQKTHAQIPYQYSDSASYIKQSSTPHRWKLLSKGVRAKVTKGNIRCVLDHKKPNNKISRNIAPVSGELKKRILLGYPPQALEANIAQAISQALTTAGYDLFMGTRHSICQGNTWVQMLEAEYQRCDCITLLLSESSLISELVTEGLKRLIAIRQTRQHQPLLILVIRVNLSANSPVNHELQSYLNQIQQWEWHSPVDTTTIIGAILNQLGPLKSQSQSNLTTALSPLPHQVFNFQQYNQKTFFSSWGHHPLPSTKPKLPETNVPSTSPLYVERLPYEQQCYQAIVKPGALIRICAPRQMGKTSLLNRVLDYAAEQNYHTALLDFQQIDKTILSDLDQLVRWFCSSITRQLNLPSNLDDYWDEDIGTKASSSIYLQNYLLTQIKEPIVIALEEISALFQEIALTQDFLTLLRCWHEKAKVNCTWAKIRFVMVQSTDAYIPLSINQSPLNVGLGINLPPFSLQEVEDLVTLHQLSFTSQELGQLMQLLEGHPYLIRLSLYYLCVGKMTLTGLLETAATDTGIYSDHLHRLLWKLYQEKDLADIFRRVLLSSSPVELEHQQASKLKSLGLITANNEQYTWSCNLYRHYFSERLT